MSQSKNRVKGYVVGSNKHGKEWVVKALEDPLNLFTGKKIVVRTVRTGTSLKRGLSVTFTVDGEPIREGVDNHHVWRAYDVTEIPRTEIKKQAAVNPVNSLSLVAVENHHPQGPSFYLTFSSYSSLTEAREDKDGCVDADDRVVGFFTLKCSEPDEAVALEALVALSQIEDGAFARMLETVFGQIFNEAMTTYR